MSLQMKQGQYSEIGNSVYQLMTSVSMPVYDLRHNEVNTKCIFYLQSFCLRVFYFVVSLKLIVEHNNKKVIFTNDLLNNK